MSSTVAAPADMTGGEVDPKICPVCGNSDIEAMVGTVNAITVQDNGNSRQFPSLSAYRCNSQGHVFFVNGELETD